MDHPREPQGKRGEGTVRVASVMAVPQVRLRSVVGLLSSSAASVGSGALGGLSLPSEALQTVLWTIPWGRCGSYHMIHMGSWDTGVKLGDRHKVSPSRG